MRQKSTVAEYVSRMKTCVNKLKGKYLEPSDGTVTVKFLRGLKPHIAKLCEDNAPDGWWKSSDEVFAKALAFETNKAAMIGNESVIAMTAGNLRTLRASSSSKSAKTMTPRPMIR